MRLYIAGPMTGLPDFNYPAFFEAEKRLQAVGYEVENPARNEPEGTASWLAFMRLSLRQISTVDGIALLPGWIGSKGARIEHKLAVGLGLEVHSVEAWAIKAEHDQLLPQRGQDPAASLVEPGKPRELVYCPECAAGKTINCALIALDPEADDFVPCATQEVA